MANRLRLFTKRFFIICTIVLVVVFLLSCLVPLLNPQSWWFISFLGLAFPFLLLLVIACFAGWIIMLKPRLALIPGVAILLSLKSISVFFAFNKPGTFTLKKEKNSLRVVSWNVARFVELKNNNNRGSQVRQKMLDLIKLQDADILCLQEFHTSTLPDFYDNITPIKQMGYPYFYFSFDTDGDNLFYSSIIFSRFPIIDSGFIRYPRPTLADVLLHADIKFNGDTVRIYTTHLQSIQFNRKDYDRLNKIAGIQDSLLENSKNIISKMKRGYSNRSIQAQMVSDVLEDSPYPKILCADLNDVPNSYTYHTVKGDMKDAFLRKGFGIGRTYVGLSPTLRIDYIFTDQNFSIRQFSRNSRRLSDHYMLVADVQLKKSAK